MSDLIKTKQEYFFNLKPDGSGFELEDVKQVLVS